MKFFYCEDTRKWQSLLKDKYPRHDTGKGGGRNRSFWKDPARTLFSHVQRASTEVHWYISHVLEPELMTVGLEAAVPGKMEQHWQLKLGSKQMEQAGGCTTHPKAILSRLWAAPWFESSLWRCERWRHCSFPVIRGAGGDSRGRHKKIPNTMCFQQNISLRKHEETRKPNHYSQEMYLHYPQRILINLATPLTVSSSCDKTPAQSALVWTKLVFCDCWERRIMVFPLSFPSSPIQMWIPQGKHLPATSLLKRYHTSNPC